MTSNIYTSSITVAWKMNAGQKRAEQRRGRAGFPDAEKVGIFLSSGKQGVHTPGFRSALALEMRLKMAGSVSPKARKGVRHRGPKTASSRIRLFFEALGIIIAGFGSAFLGAGFSMPQAFGAVLVLAALFLPDI
ncbi:MAG: hypothetical protein NTX79_04615 [Candidatus Micrarchaeota archaeon]|nr:hypothetical protein [Candidatus Micrarchaeota archaeon]